MTSGADLFVVCKQCGSEVSPYITECPYCGNRLRRRAPKLPRAGGPSRSAPGKGGIGSFLRRSTSSSPARGVRARVRPRGRAYAGARVGRWEGSRPYATGVLVAGGALLWILFHADPTLFFHTAIVGPLGGEWWKLLTTEFSYLYGFYAFAALVTIALFGWLLERRYGPLLVVGVFFGGGVTGALAACAAYGVPLASGGNGAALALLAAWAAPDLRAARAGDYYDGDLLGVAAIAALLLALPFARSFSEASWLAGAVGAAFGLIVGFGLDRTGESRA